MDEGSCITFQVQLRSIYVCGSSSWKNWAQCILCKKNYLRKGRGTNSLKNHLKSMHKEHLEEIIDKETRKAEEKQRQKKLLCEKMKSGKEECFQSVKWWDPKQWISV